MLERKKKPITIYNYVPKKYQKWNASLSCWKRRRKLMYFVIKFWFRFWQSNKLWDFSEMLNKSTAVLISMIKSRSSEFASI